MMTEEEEFLKNNPNGEITLRKGSYAKLKAQILAEVLPLHDRWMREQFADVAKKARKKALKENSLAGLSDETIDDILELIENSSLRLKARYMILDKELKKEIYNRERKKLIHK